MTARSLTLRARDIEQSRAAAAAALVDDYLKPAFADAFDRRYLVYAYAAAGGGRLVMNFGKAVPVVMTKTILRLL